MHKLLVNEIVDTGRVLYALALTDNTIQHNMALIYGDSRMRALLKTAGDHPDIPVCSIDKFHQFVVVTEHAAHTGWTMQLIDFRGDVAAYLDEYLLSTQKVWCQHDKERVIDLARSIELSVSVLPMELVVDHPVE